MLYGYNFITIYVRDSFEDNPCCYTIYIKNLRCLLIFILFKGGEMKPRLYLQQAGNPDIKPITFQPTN